MGDITGDLSAKRGHITGTDSHSLGRMLISGKVPLSELTDYQSRLNALTSGRGHYVIELSHYAPLPGPLQQQLTSGFKLKEEDQ
jgi:elongation factor G